MASDADHFRNDLIFVLGVAYAKYDLDPDMASDIMHEVAGKVESGGYTVFALNEAENPIPDLDTSPFDSKEDPAP